MLALLEAEGIDDADASRDAAIVLRQIRLRAVFDQRRAAPARNLAERVDIAHIPRQMHRNDGARAAGHLSCGRGGIHAQRPLVNVGEHGNPVQRQNGRNGAHVRNRRHDHLVTRLEIERRKRRVDGRGARCHGHGVLHADKLCQGGFEILNEMTAEAEELPAADHLCEVGEFLVTERAPRNPAHGWQWLRADGSSAVDGKLVFQ